MLWRELTGVLLTALGFILVVPAYFGDPRWWYPSAVLVLVGALLYSTQRVARREAKYGTSDTPEAGLMAPGPLSPRALRGSRRDSDSSDLDNASAEPDADAD